MNNKYSEFLLWVSLNKSMNINLFCIKCVEDNDVTGMWGYLLEFFDSVGIYIEMRRTNKLIPFVNHLNYKMGKFDMDKRPEAQQAAKDKAFEIFEAKEMERVFKENGHDIKVIGRL